MNRKRFAVLLAVAVFFAAGYYFGSQRNAVPDKTSSPTSRSMSASVVSLQPNSRTAPPTSTPVPSTTKYVLNTSTKKFHKPNCSSVKQMLNKNKEVVTWSRKEIIDKGYSPCGRCHP